MLCYDYNPNDLGGTMVRPRFYAKTDEVAVTELLYGSTNALWDDDPGDYDPLPDDFYDESDDAE